MKAIFGVGVRHSLEARLRQTLGLFRSRRRLELRHGLRITAAGLASYAISEALQLPQAYWAVFTAVLVVQGSVGGSWKASVDRFFGTLLGAGYGAVVATIVPHGDTVMLGVALTVSLLPLSILAALNPAFRVAPITAIILLVGSAGATEGPVRAAILRTLEVALGGICGMAVSLYVFPARAHMLLGRSADSALRQLSSLFGELAAAVTSPVPGDRISSRHDAIRKALKSLDDVAVEATLERRNRLSDDVDPGPISRTTRRVYHDLVLIGRVTSDPVIASPSPELSAAMRELTESGQEYLRKLGAAFASREELAASEAFDTALDGVLTHLQQLEPVERLVALRFSLQQLESDLSDLHQRAAEFAATPARGAPVKR